MTSPPQDLNALPALPRDADGPVFKAPWEARAFALAVRLSDTGLFTWSEWTEVISQEIKAAQERGDPDLGDTYYHHWLSALERLCVAKGLVAPAAMEARQEAWRRAYLNTPHGQPVNLSAATRQDDHAP